MSIHTARVLIVGTVIAAALQFAVAQVAGAGEGRGHAVLHVMFGLSVMVAAGLLTWRWPNAGAAVTAPVAGFVAFTLAQLVESIGALGYDASGGRANGLAAFHDLGLAITPIAMLAALAGIVAGIAVAGGRRQGRVRLASTAGAVVIGVGGLVVIKTLLGM